MGKDAINEPFGVINADDYYGAESFQLLGDFLRSVEDKKNCYCMIGFNIENTLSENGGVSRGLCEVNAEGNLTGVTECHGIERKNGKLIQVVEGGSLIASLPISTAWFVPHGFVLSGFRAKPSGSLSVDWKTTSTGT